MRLKSILFATMLLLCGLSFTACDNSDPDEQKPSPIETPSYTMDAAKYEITDASSAYKAVELTEAGRYIIVMKKGRVVDAGTPQDILENPSNEYTKQLKDAVPTLGGGRYID